MQPFREVEFLGKSMGNFVHEINQPLSVISNFASAAKITLIKCQSLPLSQSEHEIKKVVGWLDQIAEQAKLASQLVRAHESSSQ
jgi:phosphoglycerate-specific signal transduction histidine kinase